MASQGLPNLNEEFFESCIDFASAQPELQSKKISEIGAMCVAHAPSLLRSQSAALNGFANGRAFHAARPVIVPAQKPCDGTQDSCWLGLGTRMFGNARFGLLREGTSGGDHLSSSRRLERKVCSTGEPKTSWSVPTLGIIIGDASCGSEGTVVPKERE